MRPLDPVRSTTAPRVPEGTSTRSASASSPIRDPSSAMTMTPAWHPHRRPQWYRFAHPVQGLDTGKILGQDRSHAIVRLDRDHVVAQRHQILGHRPGTGAQVDDRGRLLGQHPFDDLARRPGPEPLVSRRHRPKLSDRSGLSPVAT